MPIMRTGPTHTKSRNGCLVCKSRRVKCDESQPRCQRCTVGGRKCAYAINRSVRQAISILPTSYSVQVSAATPPSTASSSKTGYGSQQLRLLTAGPRTEPEDQRLPKASSTILAGEQPSYNTTGSPANGFEDQHPHLSSSSEVFTVTHLRLLSHAITNMTSYMAAEEQMQPLIDYALHCTHTAPYLLHQMLALSALHCSTQQPDTAEDFLFHATALQTRALSSFNSYSHTVPVPSFIFASLLGIQILYTSLVKKYECLAEFVTDFIAFLRVYRGVRSVIDGNWDEIRTSNLEPLISVSRWIEENEMSGSGTETHRLRELLENLPDQSNVSITASLNALGYVQWMLDLKTRAPPDSGRGVHVTLAWPIVVSDEYMECLYQHRPEALAVLAFFAAALHQHPDFWGFSNAGPRIVRLVVDHVGSFWREALAWPLEFTRNMDDGS